LARHRRATGQALSQRRLSSKVLLAVLAATGLLLVLSACSGARGESVDPQHSEEIDLGDVGEAVDPVDPVDPANPDEIEMPAEEIFQGEGSAMLKIERNWDFGTLGYFEMGADFTFYTFHGLVGEPGETNKATGSTESEFTLELGRTGTTGGVATTTATGPVSYEVEGFFYPSAAGIGCEFHLVVTETLRLSQVTTMTDTQLGELPVPGLGEDIVTTFDVEFDQQALDFFVIGGENSSSFTLYDVALPDGTGCSFTG